jgi:site-specific DNA recombinase
VNEPGSEASWVEQGLDAIIAQASLRSLRAQWKAADVRTPARRYKQPDGTRGEPETREFTETEIRRVLLRARNAGLIEHKGEVVGRAQWPALAAEEKWRAAVAILRNPERRTTASHGRVWLGSGLYGCYCGETVRASTTGVGGVKKAAVNGKTHRPAYRCRTGKHVIRDVYALDEYVEGLAVARLSRPDAAELLLPPPPEAPAENLAAEANALRAKLDSIAADYATDLITRKQMVDMTAMTRARLEKVNQKMADRAAGSILATLPLGSKEIARQWKGYDLDKKKAIVDALMTVTIHPARRGRPAGFKPGTGQTYFDDSTIEIAWKRPSLSS